MTNDLRNLRATLRDRAEADADAEALLAAIRPAYRRRRNRLIAGSTTGLAVFGVLVALAVPRVLGAGPVAAPELVPGASGSGSAGVGAPGQVGSDPLMFHFAVGGFPHPVTDARWTAEPGFETLMFSGEADVPNPPAGITSYQVTITVRRDGPAPTVNPTAPGREPLDNVHSSSATVGGRPATVTTGQDPGGDVGNISISWHPADGVTAELAMHGPVPLDQLLQYAGEVRLDGTQPCALRLKATVLPPGAHVQRCEISPTDDAGGSLLIEGPGGGTILVTVPGASFPGAGISPGASVQHLTDGRAYEVIQGSDYYTASIRIPSPYAEVASHGSYGLADVLLVANGLKPN